MKNKPLYLVVNIKVLAENKEFVKAELMKLVLPTRKEVGCLSYNIYEDNKDPNSFVFYENWENYQAWQSHRQTKHMQKYYELTNGMIEAKQLFELSELA